jgi:hypothetical protein
MPGKTMLRVANVGDEAALEHVRDGNVRGVPEDLRLRVVFRLIALASQGFLREGFLRGIGASAVRS